MQLYLAVTPGELRQAASYGRALAHVAYRIGSGSTLLRQGQPGQSRGGLLSISDRGAPPISDPDALCAAVLRECGRRGCTGAVLDFEEPPRQDRLSFARRLGAALASSRRSLYLPESYAQSAGNTAAVLVCTAISGGNFVQHLREAAGSHGGAARVALDVQRLRMDFLLPCRSGEGVPLSEAQLRQLLEREAPALFFSRELCARYFTYTQNGQTHFVLFDDAGSLNQKLRAGAAMGFTAAFLMWPEVKDIIGQISFRN